MFGVVPVSANTDREGAGEQGEARRAPGAAGRRTGAAAWYPSGGGGTSSVASLGPVPFPPSSSRQAWSSRANSSIEAKRSRGLFAIARRIAASSRGGTSGRRSRTRGAGSLTCRIATATKLSPWNGTLAGEQLVEDDAERVDVASARRPCRPLRLLGRDVVGRPEHRPGLRQPVDVERARDPEVGHLRLARRSSRSTFCGLTSRWTSPCVVRERERARDLERELERLARRAAAPRGRELPSGSRRRRTRRR